MKATICIKAKTFTDTVTYSEFPEEEIEKLIENGYSVLEKTEDHIKLYKELKS